MNNSYKLKQVILLLNILFFPVLLFAQQPDSSLAAIDSGKKFVSPNVQLSDTLPLLADSVLNQDKSSNELGGNYNNALKKLLDENEFLNTTTRPVAYTIQEKKRSPKDQLFYLVAIIVLLLALLRFFYTRYFNNLFSFFLNASLRQSQLIEQLLQAKMPSLLFNLLFVFSGGLYSYLLLLKYHWIGNLDFWKSFSFCTIGLGLIYLIKFFTLRFTGWLTGFKEVTNTYIFIIFLFNKITGIFLLPFIAILAFSGPTLANWALIISVLLVAFLFLFRFLRSYALLQYQLKVSRLHFLMYVVGVEIIPVLAVYKGLVVFLSKNL